MTNLRVLFNRPAILWLIAISLFGAVVGPAVAKMRLTAPAAGSAVHPGTDDALVFSPNPGDPWIADSDASKGVTVDFVASQPFTHTVDPTYRRDVQLDLVIASAAGGAAWVVTTASDSTDYNASVNTATVSAASLSGGKAEFDLTVTLDTQSFSTMAAGEYTTTITGTLTAN